MISKNETRVLLTGGAGYIGSHTLVQLLSEQKKVCVYDNYSNSSPIALDRVRDISGADFDQVEGDIRDEIKLNNVMADFRPDVVLHFAGLKSVGEANEKPLEYYDKNVSGSIVLLRSMDRVQCRRIVFSSSATVYGEAHYIPYDEAHPMAPTNAYGRTKFFIEGILSDWAAAVPGASAILLRYFNPLGAHASGKIGENPRDIPNNILPYITQVALGKRAKLSVFGNGYDTRDGTGERDFIHVVDLANAHLAAVTRSLQIQGCEAINIGMGKGTTVLELVAEFEAQTGQTVPFEIVGNRQGDIARSIADASKAKKLMGWQASHDIADMCKSAWFWQKTNPDGYS